MRKNDKLQSSLRNVFSDMRGILLQYNKSRRVIPQALPACFVAAIGMMRGISACIEPYLLFSFYSNEHEPIHVHVKAAERESIFDMIIKDKVLEEIKRRDRQGKKPLTNKEAKRAILSHIQKK